jgi:hypothetical protein
MAARNHDVAIKPPWVRPEDVDQTCLPLDRDDEDETEERFEPYQERLGLRGQWHHPIPGQGMKVIHDGGPGKCALVVSETENNEQCLLIRRNGRDGSPQGFPLGGPKDRTARWYGYPVFFRSERQPQRIQKLLEKYVLDLELRASILRFLFQRQSWDESGMAGEGVRQQLLAERRREEEEDERLGHEAELVPYEEPTAVDEGRVVGVELEDRPEADDREPGDWEEGDEPNLFDKGYGEDWDGPNEG